MQPKPRGERGHCFQAASETSRLNPERLSCERQCPVEVPKRTSEIVALVLRGVQDYVEQARGPTQHLHFESPDLHLLGSLAKCRPRVLSWSLGPRSGRLASAQQCEPEARDPGVDRVLNRPAPQHCPPPRGRKAPPQSRV